MGRHPIVHFAPSDAGVLCMQALPVGNGARGVEGGHEGVIAVRAALERMHLPDTVTLGSLPAWANSPRVRVETPEQCGDPNFLKRLSEQFTAEHAQVRAALLEILDGNHLPLTIGGDHGLGHPIFSAISGKEDGDLGLVWVDSHTDARPMESHQGVELPSSGNAIWRLITDGILDPNKLVYIALPRGGSPEHIKQMQWVIGKGAQVIHADELDNLNEVASQAISIATSDGAHSFALSIDADVVHRAEIPGVSCRGLGDISLDQLLTLNSALLMQGGEHVRSWDVCEISTAHRSWRVPHGLPELSGIPITHEEAGRSIDAVANLVLRTAEILSRI